jgi:hypothetical protein
MLLARNCSPQAFRSPTALPYLIGSVLIDTASRFGLGKPGLLFEHGRKYEPSPSYLLFVG